MITCEYKRERESDKMLWRGKGRGYETGKENLIKKNNYEIIDSHSLFKKKISGIIS